MTPEPVAWIEFQSPVRVPLQSPISFQDDAPSGLLVVIVAVIAFLVGRWCPW